MTQLDAGSRVKADSAPDHRDMLRESAVHFAGTASKLARVRALRGIAVPFDRAIWKAMAGQGWLGILVSEEQGGLGLRLGDVTQVGEPLARSLFPEPFMHIAVLSARLLQIGQTGLGRELAERMVAGELIPVVAWQDRAGSMEVAHTSARARAHGDGVLLTGRKCFVAGGEGADGWLVNVLEPGGPALYWVTRDAPGLVVESVSLADGNSVAELHLDGVAVPASHRVASGQVVVDTLEQALDEATVATACELLGVQKAMFDMTLDYLKTRRQFGQLIGGFQALQHRAVDMYIQRELTQAVIAEAVSALEAGVGPRQRQRVASRAKARASSGALLIAKEAIQMHGAIGFTDEYDLGLYVKRALVLASSMGNAAFHRKRFSATREAVATELEARP